MIRRTTVAAALALALLSALIGCSTSIEVPDIPPIAPPDNLYPDELGPPGISGRYDFSDTEILEGPLDIRFLVERVVRANPSVRAARERWMAARSHADSVTIPDPRIEYTFLPGTHAVETRVGPQRHRVMIAQMFPWPGRLSAETEAREYDAEAARLTFEIIARDAIAETVIGYHELLYWHRAAEVIEANRAYAGQLADLAEAWLARETPEDGPTPIVPARRSVTLIDGLKARTQEAQLRFDHVTVVENLAIARAELNRLLGRPAQAPLGAPVPLADVRLTLSFDALRALAFANRQELRRAVAKAQAAGARVDAAELLAVPDFKLGVTWIGVGDNGGDQGFDNDALMLTFGMSLPFWSGNNGARRDAAAYRARAAQAELEGATQRLDAALVKAHTMFVRAQRLVELYRDAHLPVARAALVQLQALQREGESAFGEIVEAQAMLIAFELGLERARAERFRALAKLEQLVGRPLGDSLETDTPPPAPAEAPGDDSGVPDADGTNNGATDSDSDAESAADNDTEHRDSEPEDDR